MAHEQETGYRDPDTFDVRGSMLSMVEATRRHKLIVLVSCLVSLTLAGLYIYLFPPIYVASARILVEKSIDNSRDNFYSVWDVFRKDDPRTEIELMTAPSILGEVVKAENLKYTDVYHPFLSQVSYLWKNSFPGRTYHHIKDSLFPPKYDPEGPSKSDIELGMTVTDMKSGVNVAPLSDSSVGELTVKGPSRRVAKVANTLLDIYMKSRADRYRAEAQQNLDALDQEVALAAKETEDISNRKLAFQKSQMLTFDLARETQQLTKEVELEDQIAANRAKAASLHASLQYVGDELTKEPESRTSSTVVELNAVREAAKLKRLDLETALITARTVYQEDSPEVQEIHQNISALDELISREPVKVEKVSTTSLNSTRQDLIQARNSLQSQYDAISGGVTVMEQTDRQLRDRMAAVPELQTKMREFDRLYTLAADRYQALSAKRAQAAVSRAMAGAAMPSMQIVQRASPPDDPAWPKPKILFPSALFVGLILGILGAQIRSLTSGRVHRGDLERNHPMMPVYGSIRIPIGTQPFSVATHVKTNRSNGPGN